MFILRRFLAFIPVALIVALIVFLMLHLSPGDPVAAIAGDSATAADIARIRAARSTAFSRAWGSTSAAGATSGQWVLSKRSSSRLGMKRVRLAYTWRSPVAACPLT